MLWLLTLPSCLAGPVYLVATALPLSLGPDEVTTPWWLELRTSGFSMKVGCPMDARSLFQVFPCGSTCTGNAPAQVQGRDDGEAQYRKAPLPGHACQNQACCRGHLVCLSTAGQLRDTLPGAGYTLFSGAVLRWGAAYPAGRGDDDGDGQVHVVRVHQPRCDAGEAGKGCVDCIVRQDLQWRPRASDDHPPHRADRARGTR